MMRMNVAVLCATLLATSLVGDLGAQNTTAVESADRSLQGTLRASVPVEEALASVAITTKGEVRAAQCVAVLVERGRTVRGWASQPSRDGGAKACLGAAPLFLGESLFPGDAFFPGDMFFPAGEFFPGDHAFPGDMFFPADHLFPGDMFRRIMERSLEGGTGIVLFAVPADDRQRRDLLILPIIIRLEER